MNKAGITVICNQKEPRNWNALCVVYYCILVFV